MTKAALADFFNQLPKLKVVVVGDVMVDAYAWGFTERMSPEAPVPVLQIRQTEYRLGGAANVALNLQAMGVQTELLSVCGEDAAAKHLFGCLEQALLPTTGLIQSKARPTTLKTRIMSGQQQLLRIDDESLEELDTATSALLLQQVEKALNGADALILQDYDKGVLSSSNIAAILQLARQAAVPVAVDPKKQHFFDYKNVALFKPNLKELAEGLGRSLSKHNLEQVALAATELQARIAAEAVLLTLSEAGVMYRSALANGHLPAHLRSIADVSGAGDTVIAVAGCCLAANLPLPMLADLSNLAGGLVCESLGVVPIKKDKLLHEALLIAKH
ncbi:MAG: PfkB family carbohydrate kinase [Sphingobacteriaceae bacterium]|nr:PfkB family carbohydrate kinase [Sphingobacteriaceae bacterium]